LAVTRRLIRYEREGVRDGHWDSFRADVDAINPDLEMANTLDMHPVQQFINLYRTHWQDTHQEGDGTDRYTRPLQEMREWWAALGYTLTDPDAVP